MAAEEFVEVGVVVLRKEEEEEEEVFCDEAPPIA